MGFVRIFWKNNILPRNANFSSRPLGRCSFRISRQIAWFHKFSFYDVITLELYCRYLSLFWLQILDTLLTFLTPKKEEYFIRVEIIVQRLWCNYVDSDDIPLTIRILIVEDIAILWNSKIHVRVVTYYIVGIMVSVLDYAAYCGKLYHCSPTPFATLWFPILSF